MSNFQITGKLIVKDAELQVSDKFKKRDFVIEVVNEKNQDWNDFIKFQLMQDRCDLIEPISLNEEITVSFNIRGRKWEKDGKVNYFSNLEAWRVERVTNQSPIAPPVPGNDAQEDDSDLPF